jgi:uncharacterized protein YceH (UPF0502 family)
MAFDLAVDEVRVLGALIEKGATTPNQYPLSINALMHACNQKSAREPVMALTEGDIRAATDRLIQRGLVRQTNAAGARVSRFEHRLGKGPGSALGLDTDELAVLAVLMLRGAQTPGGIRARGERMAEFADTAAVEAALARLAEHEAGALVEQLPRGPGEREDRYRHCLGGGAPSQAHPAASEPEADAGEAESLEARVAELERVVEQLQAWIDDEGVR